MKNHGKKKLLFFLLLCISVVVLTVAFMAVFHIYRASLPRGCAYAEEIKVLNNSFPSDIIVYGEDVGFNEALNYRTIQQISEENLTSDSKHKYTFFVINDRQGKLEITDDEFALCKKMCDEHNMNFFYIGTQYLEHLQTFGFHRGLYTDDACGVGYVQGEMGHTTIQGLWTTTEEMYYSKNPELLGQLLAYSFVDDVIKMLN